MNGIVLHGVVGKQDEADVVVGFAGRQLKLGESVHTIFRCALPHIESLTASLLESVLLREFSSA